MSKYAENHEKMLLNKLHKYIDEEEYKYESPYITKADVEVIITALEKQIPKKPIMKPYFDDMEEEYLCCPTCGEILTDRIPMDNKDFYFHCLDCGQKLNWESDK